MTRAREKWQKRVEWASRRATKSAKSNDKEDKSMSMGLWNAYYVEWDFDASTSDDDDDDDDEKTIHEQIEPSLSPMGLDPPTNLTRQGLGTDLAV
jgi:hypothetical protein